ncbi:MAG TPA: FAD:protein FMN transferase [Pseudonocardiaceae bacterium]|nr:FAD:protein FMN transferase [Pseudonocardiaceae bacterium]
MTIAAHRTDVTGAPEASGATDVIEVRFSAIGTTAALAVTDPAAASAAETMLRADLAELDWVCSRFRADSEIRQLERTAGSPVTVSPLLAQIVDTALRTAQLTDGLVDPTVGTAMATLGYDRDFAALDVDGPAIVPVPAPGWWRISWDPRSREILLPHGISLDVGATAKALAADRAAARIAAKLRCGVLVNLGGDLAVAGPPPQGGWQVLIGDDHTHPDLDGGHGVAIESGALATSGTARRQWRRGGDLMHHILDPRTGAPAAGGWRTVSVAAASCVDANTASTTSIVLGAAAPGWLTTRGLPARLVTDDGAVHTVAGWPTTEDTPAGMGAL